MIIPPSPLIYDPAKLTRREAMLMAARAQGCTCEPDIRIGEWPHAYVEHDDWRALLRRGDRN
jgi:hypothetical protein